MVWLVWLKQSELWQLDKVWFPLGYIYPIEVIVALNLSLNNVTKGNINIETMQICDFMGLQAEP